MKSIFAVVRYALMLAGLAYLLMLGSLYFFPSGLPCANYPMFNLPSPDGRHTATAFQEVCNDGKLKTVISLSGDFPASSVGQKTVVLKAESSVTSDETGETKPLNFSAKWLTPTQLQLKVPAENVTFLTKQSDVYGVEIAYLPISAN